jgi:hypothetical protein
MRLAIPKGITSIGNKTENMPADFATIKRTVTGSSWPGATGDTNIPVSFWLTG